MYLALPLALFPQVMKLKNGFIFSALPQPVLVQELREVVLLFLDKDNICAAWARRTVNGFLFKTISPEEPSLRQLKFTMPRSSSRAAHLA